MKTLENLRIPKLTDEQIEELCGITEDAARKYVLSKVPSKRIETLNISVEAEGTKPLMLSVDIDILLSPLMKNFEVQKLVDDAVKQAFVSAEEYLRKLVCHSIK